MSLSDLQYKKQQIEKQIKYNKACTAICRMFKGCKIDKFEIILPINYIDANRQNICFKINKININMATLQELMTLEGIGESKALKIIEYREKNTFNDTAGTWNCLGYFFLYLLLLWHRNQLYHLH